MFVCVIMKFLLLRKLLRCGSGEMVSLGMGNKSVDARKGREEIMRVIEERREEGRRRS